MKEAGLLACYALAAAAVWLPCRALARRLWRYADAPVALCDLTALIIATSLGYLAFWVYLIGPRLGWWLSASFFLGGATWFLLTVARRPSELRELVSAPARVTFLVGLLYLSMMSLRGGVDATPTWFVPDTGEDPPATLYWLMPRSIDSLIPIKFAAAVAAGGPVRGDINFTGWRFSDRPPLQAGVLLLCWPLTGIFGTGIVNLAVGVWLQVQWVLGVSALAWALRLGRSRISFVLLALATSGFVYFNSVYVWPKMLAAALWMAGLAPMVHAWRERRATTIGETLLAGAATALAMLAHGSIAFSILATAAVGASRRVCRSPRFLLPAGAIAVSFYLPWMAYQKCVDPPGDRCLKLMFANDDGPESETLAAAVRRAYAPLSWRSWVNGRLRGFMRLLGDEHLDHNMVECVAGIVHPRPAAADGASPFRQRYYFEPRQLSHDWPSLAAMLRYDQVEQTFRALALWNLAWPILLVAVIRTRGRCLARRDLRPLLAVTGLTLLAWSLLIFVPEFLIIRNSSYGMMLGLGIVAALVVYDTPWPLRWTIFGAHFLTSLLLWVLFVPTDFAREHLHLTDYPRVAPVVGVIVAVAGLFATRWRCSLRGQAGRLTEPPHPVPTRKTHAAARAAVGIAGLVVITSTIAIATHRLRPEVDGLPQCRNFFAAEKLWDGIVDEPDNHATCPFDEPGIVTFPSPRTLREIRLHLFDFDGRRYAFLVDGLAGGRWVTLADYSQQLVGGTVAIPVGSEALDAFRVRGLDNTDLRTNPANRALHITEVELVEREQPTHGLPSLHDGE